MSDNEFGLIEPFNIDDGQLDGMTPQECFVQGYELAVFSCEAETNPESFHKLAKLQNLDRIKAALKKRKRTFKVSVSHEDKSESWCEITVDKYDDTLELMS